MSEDLPVTMSVGLFMVHNIIDFVCTDEGAAAFCKFIDSNVPGPEKGSPEQVKRNAEVIHDWWVGLIGEASQINFALSSAMEGILGADKDKI